MSTATLARAASPDGRPRRTTVRLAGVAVGTVRYAWDPHHLVIHALDVPAHAVDATLSRLLRPYDGLPARLTHYGVRDAAALAWYRASALLPGLVATGAVDDAHHVYDPLRCLPSGAPDLTLVYDRTLLPVGAPDQVDLPTAHAWLTDPDLLLRTAAVRRLALDRTIAPDVVDAAHRLALVNEASGVRQLASVALSRPDLRPEPLLRLFADPLAVWTELGLPSPALNAARTRRDARYAVAWILANAVRMGHHEVLAALADRVTATPDEARVRRMVTDEWGAEPYAFGDEAPLTLADWLRFAIVRERVVAANRLSAVDAFGWLARDARLLLGHLPALAATTLAPSAVDVVASEMPAWMARP